MRSERQASTLTPIKRFTIICSVNAILRKCNRKTKRETFVALVKDILWIMITTSCLPSKVKNLEEFFLQKKNVSEKSKVIFFSHLLIERRYLFVVFVAVHDQAHQAFDVTYRKLAQRFFWRGIHTDTQNYVKSCKNCQLDGPKKMRTVKPKLRSIVPPQKFGPWWELT